jgi:threonine/homoserine/homoserine lactone efflux protein
MNTTSALAAGLVAGLAIAAQVGAVSLLLVDTALANGPRVAVAAGMGVATADFAFAILAALGGGAAGAALTGHEAEIQIVAGAVLAGIAVRGLVRLTRERPDGVHLCAVDGENSARAQYTRLLAITAVNPLTIASFAAVAASLSLHGVAPYAAFVAGVGIASAGWHLFLTLTAAHVGRWITPRVQRGLGIAGRVAILLIAARLVIAA